MQLQVLLDYGIEELPHGLTGKMYAQLLKGHPVRLRAPRAPLRHDGEHELAALKDLEPMDDPEEIQDLLDALEESLF